MFEIDIDTQGLRATDELISRLRDFGPALGEVGAYLEGKNKLRFAKQVDPSGNPWAPLKDSTIADKTRRGAPLEILIDRAILVSSFFFEVSADEVRLKTNEDYLKWLQDGTRNMEARPVLGFEPGDSDAISRIFRRHISGQL